MVWRKVFYFFDPEVYIVFIMSVDGKSVMHYTNDKILIEFSFINLFCSRKKIMKMKNDKKKKLIGRGR